MGRGCRHAMRKIGECPRARRARVLAKAIASVGDTHRSGLDPPPEFLMMIHVPKAMS